MRSGFFMGTQSIIIALMIPIMFIVLGVIVYKYYHGNHLSDIYNYLFVAVIVVSFVGAFLKDEFVKESKIMSSNIVELNDFYEIKREETIFLDYAVYRKNEKELEYVDIKYKGYDDYVFDKIADGDKIVATDRIDGYDIGYSKDYIYISKDRNILKTNIIRDVHEFVRKLNW